MASTVYDYSPLRANGVTPTAVYANGTRIYRLRANNADYIHKRTVYSVQARWETSITVSWDRYLYFSDCHGDDYRYTLTITVNSRRIAKTSGDGSVWAGVGFGLRGKKSGKSWNNSNLRISAYISSFPTTLEYDLGDDGPIDLWADEAQGVGWTYGSLSAPSGKTLYVPRGGTYTLYEDVGSASATVTEY